MSTWPYDDDPASAGEPRFASSRAELVGPPSVWVAAAVLVIVLRALLSARPEEWGEPWVLRWLRSVDERPLRSWWAFGCLLRALTPASLVAHLPPWQAVRLRPSFLQQKELGCSFQEMSPPGRSGELMRTPRPTPKHR